MKHIIPLLLTPILASAWAYGGGQAGADQPDRPALRHYTPAEMASLPWPVHQPVPAAGRRLIGTEFKLRFIVDESGRPERVRIVDPSFGYSDDEALSFAMRMRDAVARWRFEPALDGYGIPISAALEMPVRVVGNSGRIAAIAALKLDRSSKG